jgi:hypothetical protein
MGPRASLDTVVVVKRKNPCSYQELNHSHPVHSPVTILTELPWLHTAGRKGLLPVITPSFTWLQCYYLPFSKMTSPTSFINHYTKFQDLILNGTSVVPTSQVQMAAMLVIMKWERVRVQRLEGHKWHDIHTKFHENRSLCVHNKKW